MHTSRFERRQFLRLLGAGAMTLRLSGGIGAKSLRGIFPIAQSPFDDSGKLDLEVLAEQVRFLDRGHVHGCVWPQIASEWSTLTESERLAGAEAITATGRKLRPAIVIGVQAPTMETAVRYAKHAARNGADAIISLPPAKASTPELVEYYKAVGRAADLPLFAQAVGDMSVDQLIDIHKAVPTLTYVKDEAGQPLDRFADLREKSGGKLNIFTGSYGKTLIDEMIRGFSGSMPSAPFADLYASAWDLWHEGKRREAVEMFGKASILIQEVMVYGTPAVKYILCQRGVFKTYSVRPQGKGGARHLDDKTKQVLTEMLDLMKPYFRA